MRLVDAFTGPGCRGNRAAVVLLEAPLGDREMQALAAQAGQPATAFVAARPDRGAHAVRWFGPAREIALCGHGALAAGHVLLSQTGDSGLNLRTGDGRLIELRRAGRESRYELALPALASEPRDWPELLAVLGAEPRELRWNAAGYALAVYANPQEVQALKPDPAALARIGHVQVSASAAGALSGMATDITSRVFSSGGREDAATGSAHAMLAPFWCARLERGALVAHQASECGGWIECRLEGDRVWLGGRCAEAAVT